VFGANELDWESEGKPEREGKKKVGFTSFLFFYINIISLLIFLFCILPFYNVKVGSVILDHRSS
jgi:hypothetical protein